MTSAEVVVDGFDEVHVERVSHKSMPPNSTKHTFTRLFIEGLKDTEPVIAVTPGELGVSRIVHATAYPIGTYFDAAWDGNALKPSFRFDMYPEDEGFEVMVEVWGF